MDKKTSNIEIIKELLFNADLNEIILALQSEIEMRKFLIRKHPAMNGKKINEIMKFLQTNQILFMKIIDAKFTIQEIDITLDFYKKSANERNISLTDMLLLVNLNSVNNISNNADAILNIMAEYNDDELDDGCYNIDDDDLD